MWSIFETKKRRLADFLQGFRKNIKKFTNLIFLFFNIFVKILHFQGFKNM